MIDYVITTNSPGEVAAWVTPFVKEIRVKRPDARITVVVPPCTFASGKEVEVLKKLEIDQYLSPKEYLTFILLNRMPNSFVKPGKDGVVVHLGGDFFYTAILSRKLGLPAIAYTEGLITLKKPFSFFCVPYEKVFSKVANAGVDPKKVLVIGNLMVDAVKFSVNKCEFHRVSGLDEKPYILLLPGSRPYEIKHVAPLFVETLMLLREEGFGYNFLIALSSFVSVDELINALSILGEVSHKQFDLSSWKLTIQTQSGCLVINVVQGCQYDAMKHSHFVITIPGTNTAELAVLEKPALVVLPLNWPREIPLEGLPGLVGSIPLVGPILKEIAVKKAAQAIKLTALPNMIAGYEIYQELRGDLSARIIADHVSDFNDNLETHTCNAMDAARVVGKEGAAGRLLNIADIAAGQLGV